MDAIIASKLAVVHIVVGAGSHQLTEVLVPPTWKKLVANVRLYVV